MKWENPEMNAIHNIEHSRRIDEIGKVAREILPMYDKVHSYIEKVTINPRELGAPFDRQMIDRDLEYLENKKRNFYHLTDAPQEGASVTPEEVRKLAEILEYQVLTGINRYNWIPGCSAIKTSEFDDVINGIDMVIEYADAEKFGHLGVGIDITFAQNLYKKFARIKDEIDKYDGKENHLGTIKYFESKQSGIRGSLYDLPHAVASFDIGVMDDLSRKVTSKENHIARHALLMEIEHQLKAFTEYAEKNNPLCAPKLKRGHAFVRALSTQLKSEEILQTSEYRKNKKAEAAIEEGLSVFK